MRGANWVLGEFINDCLDTWCMDGDNFHASPELDVHVTMVDGRVTTAVVRFGDTAGLGAALCSDEDTPDPETGVALALGRALQNLGAKLKAHGWALANCPSDLDGIDG